MNKYHMDCQLVEPFSTIKLTVWRENVQRFQCVVKAFARSIKPRTCLRKRKLGRCYTRY